MIAIKQKLNEMREKSGFSIAQVEQGTKLSHSTIRRMFDVNDDSVPSFDNVVNVVVMLGGSIDELIGLKSAEAYETAETPLTRAYNRIIDEKDARINRLEIAHSLQRKEKYAVAAALFVIIAVIAVILIIDFSNGSLGYVRYQ